MKTWCQPATIADLFRMEGQAELIGGRILSYPPHRYGPGVAIANIAFALTAYALRTGQGEAFTSTLVYAVAVLPSGRETFSPDASYYNGPDPDDDMGPILGPPTFAIEVRDVHDDGQAAEDEMAAKRGDYFTAGTLAVWDVDTVAQVVRRYTPGTDVPTLFQMGEIADAEPAVPGWTMSVNDVFA